MKISEKQVMTLLNLARSFQDYLNLEGDELKVMSIVRILNEITSQQSDEMREVE